MAPAHDLKSTLWDAANSLRGILDAPVDQLNAVKGLGSVTAGALHIIKAAATLNLQQSGVQVGFLDSGYRLLPDGVEILEEGTIDRATVYPRRVVESALRRGAAAVVLAHSHPNGHVQPSEQDTVLTRAIVMAADTVGVKIVDHLIVSASESFSFRKAGLL